MSRVAGLPSRRRVSSKNMSELATITTYSASVTMCNNVVLPYIRAVENLTVNSQASYVVSMGDFHDCGEGNARGDAL